MSLVDYYASSSEDDEDTQIKGESKPEDTPLNSAHIPQPKQQSGVVLPNERMENVSRSTAPSSLKLPDASILLNMPTLPSCMGSGTDHSSRVATAMAESASRKREAANGFNSSIPRGKIPRGTLRHTKNIPDTAGGLLVPPQLSGRSNVVTEDVGKLFVRRLSDPSSRLNAI